MFFLDVFIISFLIVIVTIPITRLIAIKIGFMDYPRGRKKHNKPKPMLASLNIYFSIIICLLIFFHNSSRTLTFILLSGMIVIIGLFDDYKKTKHDDLSALTKGSLQVIVAVLTYFSGTKFSLIILPFNIGIIHFNPLFSFLFTVIWIFGIITVINFSDGIDGLASTISTISSMTFFIIMIIKGNYYIAYLCIILSGCCLSYFFYNKYPSKIFMGDSGSALIGYTLAVISLDGLLKQATFTTILLPVICLALPIFDNILVIFERLKEKQPFYIGDRKQLHYRLIDYGFSVKKTWLLLTSLSIVLSLITILITIL
ncbi:MraY family glycosyltransferase [Apilactobacillus quenuiae]|uniref:MraY family glycosyltransferase n=1 Tax=Apilactobacillus quenuiae TaxID=2008377 RepID=UPI000D01B6FD|nr:MraY family glycosyltransferase [Apilactobacillus quenuiae]